MADINKDWDPTNFIAEVDFDANSGYDQLKTAIINRLFSWQRRPDELAARNFELNGFWADELVGERFGSLLWLLQREKITNEVLTRAQQYARDALQPLIDQEVCTAIFVEAVRQGVYTMCLNIIVFRDELRGRGQRFEIIWSTNTQSR